MFIANVYGKKAAGAKWDGINKAWVFESWDQLNSALEAM